ncbi:secretion protein HlyD [Brevibacillus halotolerans]|uniref:efflux RND transporter periplasmic adaptor subunit n=1 Tax=Brevibacillus halotolerans TaxID=1507437 RepID=UPI001B2F19AB|nr:efflux RND transporter periplasmic adaptor subunit [Brevibacillus halotolerans]GIO01286.1 secretion protein HlyD [Brevibacillus halotolerans]
MLGSTTRTSFLSGMGKRKRRIITGAVAIALLCGTGVFAYSKLLSPSRAASIMQTTQVQRGDVSEVVTASGTVQAAQQVTVNFPSGDQSVTAINVKIGDTVKAGQVLATMDQSAALMQIKIAEANLLSAKAGLAEKMQAKDENEIVVLQSNVTKAKAALESAKKNYDNQKALIQQEKASATLQEAQKNLETQKKLYEAGAISKSELDQAQNSLNQAEAEYKTASMQHSQTVDQSNNNVAQAQAAYDSALAQFNQAKAPVQESSLQAAKASIAQAEVQLQQQQQNLEKLTLKAPMDGVILQVNGQVGEAASSPFLIMDNSNSEQLGVMAQISQNDIGKIKQGMEATFTIGTYNNKKFQGKVETVYPEGSTESGVTTYKVLLTVENKEGLLKPGMTLQTTIHAGAQKNVLYVPITALREQGGKTGVLVKGKDGASTDTDTQADSKGKSRDKGQNVSGFQFKEVTTGLIGSDRVEITSGLEEGDQILLTMQVTNSSSNSRQMGQGPMSSGMGGMPVMGGGMPSGGASFQGGARAR